MNRLVVSALFAPLALSTSIAFATPKAASSFDIEVKGTITPSACSLNVDRAGVMDFGAIDVSTLNRNSPTTLANTGQGVSVIVACNADTLVAMTALDQNADSVAPGLFSPEEQANYVIGLGKTGEGKPIGAAMLLAQDVNQARGHVSMAPGSVYSSNNGGSWVAGSEAIPTHLGLLKAPSDPNQIDPQAITGWTFNMRPQVKIDAAANIGPITTDLPFQGKATLQLYYL